MSSTQHIFFIKPPPLPPTPTLFPYTTLFRSSCQANCPRRALSGLHARREFEVLQAQIQAKLQSLNLRLQEDRKSTRLNSSHVAISYAVFCLKKKKKLIMII